MAPGLEKHTSNIERIERALILLAYCIELDGDAHLAMYKRFEAELSALRETEDTKARARRRLAEFREAIGVDHMALPPSSIGGDGRHGA